MSGIMLSVAQWAILSRGAAPQPILRLCGFAESLASENSAARTAQRPHDRSLEASRSWAEERGHSTLEFFYEPLLDRWFQHTHLPFLGMGRLRFLSRISGHFT